ncbi:MAG: aldo/keto reductase [bacterium]|nr:aldo/keto reductase [bacterium]
MIEKFQDILVWFIGCLHGKCLVSPEIWHKITIQIFFAFFRTSINYFLMVLGFIGLIKQPDHHQSIDRFYTPKRRDYSHVFKTLKAAGSLATLAGIAKMIANRKAADEETLAPLPTNPLGSMGFNASVLGMGGATLSNGTQAEAVAMLETAFQLGINYFDTASQYGDGESERRYGEWLTLLNSRGQRGEIFLATKTLSRGYNQAAEEIEASFTRLGTEYIDLLQVHSVNDIDTLRQVTSRNGSLKAIEQARDSGRVRHIGITGHKDPAIIMQAIEEYPFESVLMPLGIIDRYYVPFIEDALPACVAKGLSVVAMKVFAEGNLVTAGADLMKCLQFTMTLPISTAIIGMGSIDQVIQNVGWVKSFVGMTPDQIDELEEQVKGQIDTDVLWWKK